MKPTQILDPRAIFSVVGPYRIAAVSFCELNRRVILSRKVKRKSPVLN
jgi:hypothetical protein